MAPLPRLKPGEPFPPARTAWGADSDAPGLLALGADLGIETLKRAYQSGIFPWFSAGQPILWWSPDPRMVLKVENFRLHRSLRKTMQRFIRDPDCEIRMDSSFKSVIQACAQSERAGPPGTWIVPQMVRAYTQLHEAGHAHSVETWIRGELAGGLYCVALGGAVFGESMFARASDASKIALAALVAFCREHGMEMIDCQQNTRHLASLGAREMPRSDFLSELSRTSARIEVPWRFSPLYWNHICSPETST